MNSPSAKSSRQAVPRARATAGSARPRLDRALVKPPPDTFDDALTADTNPCRVDVELARRQHAAYVAILCHLGLAVRVLDSSNEWPDSCFVQDIACAIDGRLIVGRPGAASRRGEAASLMPVLAETRLELCEIVEPATLDCGDVLVTESALFVGLSSRTNQAALDQLRSHVRRPVIGVPLPAGLHLLSSCSYLGDSRLLVTSALAAAPELQAFQLVVLSPDDWGAANVLVIGDSVILPAGFSRAEAALRNAGLRPLPLGLSEFAKRDGGPTCLSLLY